jgi:hypothetical protein
MTNQYKTYTILDPEGKELTQIQRIDADGTIWFIPSDPANSDYQAYLASLEAPQA